jgi:hypothetical protein
MVQMAWKEVWWSEGCFQEAGRVEYEWAAIMVGWGWFKYWDDEETLNYEKHHFIGQQITQEKRHFW